MNQQLLPTEAPPRFWTKARVMAAQLIAEGQLTNKQIAQHPKVHKSEPWLYETKRTPWFKARVKELVDELAEDARRIGIANQRTRLEEQNARWEGMIEVRRQRAREYGGKFDGIPGVSTGLMVPIARLVKVYNVYADSEDEIDEHGPGEGDTLYSAKRDVTVIEWEYDAALEAAQSRLEKQVAAELGQTADKGKDGDTNIYGGQVLIVRDVPRLGV